jgi:deoxycytidylate deaminase
VTRLFCNVRKMSSVDQYLELAATVSRIKNDSRTFYHGAVGVRSDGVLVAAQNGCPKEPMPQHHCEFRILRKLGKGGVIYLVRTLADGTWADTTPCVHCEKAIINRKVSLVWFTRGHKLVRKWRPMSESLHAC